MIHGRRHPQAVVLELTGAEAQDGLPLSAFETFIEAFRRALREFDLVQRLEPARKGGRPTRRSEMVTAFRLVEFTSGSAIVTIEPIAEDLDEISLLPEDAETLPVQNLRALLDVVEAGAELAPDITDALDAARRALGEDGRIGVVLAGTPPSHSRRVIVGAEQIERLEAKARERPKARALTISGRLHLIDLEPSKVGIRDTKGIEWLCRYPDSLEAEVKALLDNRVWARGTGELHSPQRGAIDLEEIHSIEEIEQTPLFTTEPVPTDELLARQDVSGPQGWDAFADPDWKDDEESRLYDEAIFGRATGGDH